MNIRIAIVGLVSIALAACAFVRSPRRADAAPLAGVTENSPAYTDHARLMVYRDAEEREHPVTNREDWLKRRKSAYTGRHGAGHGGRYRIFGAAAALDASALMKRRRSKERATRLALSYAVDENDRVPAYLYLPAGRPNDERRPGILALHPTGPTAKRSSMTPAQRPTAAMARSWPSGVVVLGARLPFIWRL